MGIVERGVIFRVPETEPEAETEAPRSSIFHGSESEAEAVKKKNGSNSGGRGSKKKTTVLRHSGYEIIHRKC